MTLQVILKLQLVNNHLDILLQLLFAMSFRSLYTALHRQRKQFYLWGARVIGGSGGMFPQKIFEHWCSDIESGEF